MNGWAAKLISKEVADKVGKVWGLGTDNKYDPGPWVGAVADHGGKLACQVHRVVDPAVESHAAKRIVEVGGVAREEHPSGLELSQRGISSVVLDPRACSIDGKYIFWYLKFPKLPKFLLNSSFDCHDGRWLRQQLKTYWSEYYFWQDFFCKRNVKIYVSWFKYDASHCVIADAIKSVGGLSVIYQRAFEELPSRENTIAADIVFGFSPLNADIEKKSDSCIKYHVAVGFLGDYRFNILKNYAATLRGKIKNNGAQKILAYFDENSASDARWSTDHEFMRKPYAILLEKVLQEPWLGLVIKPKVPLSLHKRLGPIAEILKKAEGTGRCIVIGGGNLQGAYPPALAALAADISIHGCLCAATAGLESALTGTPTLLFDGEGWPGSRLYGLGKNEIVFTEWDELWRACLKHWRQGGGIPNFGDWSRIIDELDPYRDGLAAERMGTYLKWLIDGFKQGLSREVVMADAAQRYSEIWGKDKISEVKCIKFSLK